MQAHAHTLYSAASATGSIASLNKGFLGIELSQAGISNASDQHDSMMHLPI